MNNAFNFHPSDPAIVREFKPVNKNVLVLLDVAAQASSSGLIYIPTTAQKEQQTGLIVSVSPDVDPEFGLSPRMRVLLDFTRGTIISEDSKHRRTFVSYDVNDIIATMEA